MRPHDSIAETHVGSDYTDEEREFLIALERYRQSKQRRFPSCREILQVIKELGYQRPRIAKRKSGTRKPETDTDETTARCAARKPTQRKALPLIAKPTHDA